MTKTFPDPLVEAVKAAVARGDEMEAARLTDIAERRVEHAERQAEKARRLYHEVQLLCAGQGGYRC